MSKVPGIRYQPQSVSYFRNASEKSARPFYLPTATDFSDHDQEEEYRVFNRSDKFYQEQTATIDIAEDETKAATGSTSHVDPQKIFKTNGLDSSVLNDRGHITAISYLASKAEHDDDGRATVYATVDLDLLGPRGDVTTTVMEDGKKRDSRGVTETTVGAQNDNAFDNHSFISDAPSGVGSAPPQLDDSASDMKRLHSRETPSDPDRSPSPTVLSTPTETNTGLRKRNTKDSSPGYGAYLSDTSKNRRDRNVDAPHHNNDSLVLASVNVDREIPATDNSRPHSSPTLTIFHSGGVDSHSDVPIGEKAERLSPDAAHSFQRGSLELAQELSERNEHDQNAAGSSQQNSGREGKEGTERVNSTGVMAGEKATVCHSENKNGTRMNTEQGNGSLGDGDMQEFYHGNPTGFQDSILTREPPPVTGIRSSLHGDTNDARSTASYIYGKDFSFLSRVLNEVQRQLCFQLVTGEDYRVPRSV